MARVDPNLALVGKTIAEQFAMDGDIGLIMTDGSEFVLHTHMLSAGCETCGYGESWETYVRQTKEPRN